MRARDGPGVRTGRMVARRGRLRLYGIEWSVPKVNHWSPIAVPIMKPSPCEFPFSVHVCRRLLQSVSVASTVRCSLGGRRESTSRQKIGEAK